MVKLQGREVVDYFKYLGSTTQEKGSTARVEWVETRGDLGQKDSSKREKGKFIRR